MTFSKFTEHSKPLFTRLKILNVYSIYMLQAANFMHKILNNYLLNYETFIFQTNSYVHSHDTRSKHKLHKEQCNTQSRQNTFRFQGLEFWNIVPQVFKDINLLSYSVDSRKRSEST
jgi:hypothetical protein